MGDGESTWVEVLDTDWSGQLRLVVRGRSMWPTLRPGDQVTVEPVTVDGLRTGDWVLMQEREKLFLHRFLEFTHDGLLLTKGDGHRQPDSPWSPQALRGRAVVLCREGRIIALTSRSVGERARTVLHRTMAVAWSFLRRAGLSLILLATAATTARAAVDLVSFDANSQGGVAILVTWETASEVKMSHFYVQRALSEEGEYQRISGIITAVGGIVGALYEYTDADVEMGITYYYRLEAVESGGHRDFHGPVPAVLSSPATATSTPSPTPTATPRPRYYPPPLPTSTATPTPTPTSPATSTRTPRPTTPSDATTSTWTPEPQPVGGSSVSSPAPTPTGARSGAASGSSAPTAAPGQQAAAPTRVVSAIQTPSGTQAALPVDTPPPRPVLTAGAPSLPSSTSTPASSRTPGQPANPQPPLSWGLMLGPVVVGGALIVLGVWGLWRTRNR